jgi:hypothetical protein
MNWSLSEELAAVRGELARVDSKCATLAGLAGAAAAFTASQAGHGPAPVRAAVAAAGVAFTAAVLVLLLTVLRPCFGTAGWCRYAAMTAEQIGNIGRHGWTGPHRGRGTSGAEMGPEDLVALARITGAKYRRFRVAVDLAAVGVVLLAIAVVGGAIA